MLFPLAVTILGYHIIPAHPLEMVGVILLSIAIFSCIGAALGVAIKRTLPVASLVFGLSLPLYICSNSLEPQRFDGYPIWLIAHISPVYYSVGILEQAFHDLQVTPESVPTNFLFLLGWAAIMLSLVVLLLRNALIEKSRPFHPALEFVNIFRTLPNGRVRRQLPLACSLLLVIAIALIGEQNWLTLQHQIAPVSPPANAQTTLSVAADQQQETLLSNYIDQISDMLIYQNLLQARGDNATRMTANALTRDALHQLTPPRKVALLLFLYQTKLIDDDYHVIAFDQDELQTVQLANADLRDSDLSGGDFHAANLQHVNLSFSVLTNANLSNANLAGINLRGAAMQHVNITNANLAGADLTGVVGLSDADLGRARSLAGATLPNGSTLPGTSSDSDD
jgi:uncharacterized protein YjbI with pentapeptide repeats